MASTEVLQAIADALLGVRQTHPLRVGVDGRSAAGKTTFAVAQAAYIRQRGREVLRASIDDFHRPGHKYRSIERTWTPKSYYDEASTASLFIVGPHHTFGVLPARPPDVPLRPDQPRRPFGIASSDERIEDLTVLIVVPSPRPSERCPTDVPRWLMSVLQLQRESSTEVMDRSCHIQTLGPTNGSPRKHPLTKDQRLRGIP